MEEFGESQYLDVLKNSTTSAKHQPAAKAAVRGIAHRCGAYKMKNKIYILIPLILVCCDSRKDYSKELEEEPSKQVEILETPKTKVPAHKIDTIEPLVKMGNQADTFYQSDRMIICDSSFTIGLENNLEELLDSIPNHIQKEIDLLAKRTMESAAKDDSLFSGKYFRSFVKHFRTREIEELFFLVGYSFNEAEYDSESAPLFIYGAYLPSHLLWSEEQSDFMGEIQMNLWGVKKINNKYEIFGESYPYFRSELYKRIKCPTFSYPIQLAMRSFILSNT